jgi:hypothetical protein
MKDCTLNALQSDEAIVVHAARHRSPASKRLSVVDGKLVKTTLKRDDEGEIIEYKGPFSDFRVWHEGLGPNDVIFGSTFTLPVGTKLGHRSAGADASASKDHMTHVEGEPGLLVIDVDTVKEDVPVWEPKSYSTHEEVIAAIDDVVGYELELIVVDSTAGGIISLDGTEFRGRGGFHAYAVIENAAETGRVMEALHRRAWLGGYGWGYIDNGGGFQDRSLIDLAMARVTQPNFAAPVLADGVEQDRCYVYRPGERLDPAKIDDVSDDDFSDALQPAKDALEPDRIGIKEAAKERRVQEMIEGGVDPEDARRQVESLQEKKELYADFEVTFENGDVVAVRDLRNRGKKYDCMNCLDPLEPDYDAGRYVARFYWNNGMRQMINSFAHSGRVFELMPGTAPERSSFIDLDRFLATENDFDDEETTRTKGAHPLLIPDEADLPRRQWVLGTDYLRGACGLTIAPGGVGKSTLVLQEAIAIATGDGRICGGDVVEQTKVWYINAEEPSDEIKRRAAGVLRHFEVSREQVDGRVFFSSGVDDERFIVAKESEEGAVMTPDVGLIIREIKRLDIGVLIVDPFVRVHSVRENDNDAIDTVVAAFSKIAALSGCAVQIVHHTRKPPSGSSDGFAGNADSGRGASSLIGGVRIARTLYSISEKHAKKIQIPDRERHNYARLDNAKANYAEPSPSEKPQGWFKREGVKLLNGDAVGVLLPHDFSEEMLEAADKDDLAAKELLKDVWPHLPEDGSYISVNKAATALAKVDAAYSMFLEASGERANKTLRDRIAKASGHGTLGVYVGQDWEDEDGSKVTVERDHAGKEIRRWFIDE